MLYNQVMNVTPENFADPDRDRYIQSKGHSVEALYAVLADKGFFPPDRPANPEPYRSHYIGHPTRKVHGIEQNTGALGHGLALASGWRWRPKWIGGRTGFTPCWATANWRKARTGKHR